MKFHLLPHIYIYICDTNQHCSPQSATEPVGPQPAGAAQPAAVPSDGPLTPRRHPQQCTAW